MSAGPALGGLLVSALGAPVAVLVDAATYLYSAFTLSRVDISEPPAQSDTEARHLVREMREGVRWAYRGSSGLATLSIATHGWFVGNAIVGVVLAPYALTNLGLAPFQFGLTAALGGAGAVVGAVITTKVGLLLGTGRTIIASHVITTLGVLVLFSAAATTQTWAAVAVLGTGQGLYGLAMGMSNSHEMSYRQLVTPDELQARTNTTLRSVNRAAMVVAAPAAGIMADVWSIPAALIVAAVVFAVVSCGLALTPFRVVRAPA
jgi:MFS family permease